jgi:molecular chaperone GrpE
MSTEQETEIPASVVESATDNLMSNHEADLNFEEEVATLNAIDPQTAILQLERELEAAQRKAQENWEKTLRIQADMDNLKRRSQKDLEDARKYALERFAKELIPVVDSLELGLQAIAGDSSEVQKFREGSELTLKQFAAVFAKFNIEILNPLGLVFNPELHQAMAMQASAEVAPNTVLNVFQKGYSLQGRLLRPAMVVVAKAVEI